MADKKISALTGATTPLAGTEVLPIVQGSATVKVTVDNLTAGKAVSVGSLSSAGEVVAGTSLEALRIRGLVGGTTNWALYSGNLTPSATNYTIQANYLGGYPTFNAAAGTFAIISVGDVGVAKFDTPGITAFTGNFIPNTAGKGVNFTANTPAAGMTSQLLNWYEEGTWTPNQGSGLVVVGAFTSSGTYTRVGRQVTVVGTIRGGTSVSASSAGQITSNLPFTASNLFVGSVINDTVTTSSGIYTSSASINAVEAITATPAIYFSITYFV